MKIEPFGLERWLLKPSEIEIAGGGVTKLKLEDITQQIDYAQLVSYGVTRGARQLREEIAEWFTGVGQENILLTTGTSEANLLLNLHLLSEGGEYVAIFPEYGQTTPVAEALGCLVKRVLLQEDSDWQLDLEDVKRAVTKRTRVIFFDNPNNPTGAVLTRDQIRGICEIAEEVGAYVVCDNALRGSELNELPAATPFENYERGVITGSMSKLGMTGLRIGWIIGDGKLIEDCWKIKDYTTLSHSGFGERLATVAMQRENLHRYIQRNIRISKRNLELLIDWIPENAESISWVPPKAGFTGFPRFQSKLSSVEFCAKFLQEEGVLMSPGEYFGLDKHFRINIGGDESLFKEALKRLAKYLSNLPH
jgi:hypothetical protein